MTADTAQKRQWVQAWLRAHEAYRVPLHSGGELEARDSTQRLATALGDRGHRDSLYVLVRQDTPLEPLYIGKSRQPLQRWRSHLRGVQSGQGTYARWQPHWDHPLALYVIPGPAISASPIPDFPTTVGSVEYQLIGLCQDAFPNGVNIDGVAR